MKKIITALTPVFYAFAVFAQSGEADSAFYQHKQALWLKAKTGTWSVTSTLTPEPGKPAMVLTGITAERTMVGAFCLQETMTAPAKSSNPHFNRIAYLDYNLNDKRWDYASVDTRLTAGIMSFANYETTGDSIVSYILNFPHPGFGPVDRGKNVKVRNVFSTLSPDHETVKQYWTLTDGPEWLAVTYDYSRKK